MKQLSKGLLLATIAVGSMHAHTNKTFLASRPVGVNLAMEQTTWHTQVNKKIESKDEKFGASIQATGFYQENTNEEQLGRYFGFSDRRTLVVGLGNTTGVDIDRRHLFHSPNNTFPEAQLLGGTINLQVDHEAAGVRFDYFQDLDSLLKGLYFKVRAPIIWERNEVILGLSGSVSQTFATTTANNVGGSTVATTGQTIADYFCGIATGTGQAALTHARICGSDSETSLADVDLILGWNLYETRKHHIGINVAVTFPTSHTPDGVKLFESYAGGNRGHWAVGGGIDAKFRPYNNENSNLEVLVVADYRYLFEDSETRTLGLNNRNWGQYHLLGQNNVPGVFPAANVLTQKVDVEPGSQLDLLIGLAYNTHNWTFDVGYNLYAREREDVDGGSLTANTYGLAGNNYEPGTTFNSDDIPSAAVTIGRTQPRAGSAQTFLATSDLDRTVAETPGFSTHKIYGGVGYAFNEWDTPVMLGIGGAYEFNTSNDSLENWMIWGKLGLTF